MMIALTHHRVCGCHGAIPFIPGMPVLDRAVDNIGRRAGGDGACAPDPASRLTSFGQRLLRSALSHGLLTMLCVSRG